MAKGRACEEVAAASTIRIEGKTMSKREQKQAIVSRSKKLDKNGEKFGFKMSTAHPAGSQQRPQTVSDVVVPVRLSNTNGIKRTWYVLFRAPSNLNSLP